MSVAGSEFVENNQIIRPIHVVASPYKTGTTSVGKAIMKIGIGTEEMKYRPKIFHQYRSVFEHFAALANAAIGPLEFLDEHGDAVRNDLAGFTQKIARFDVFADMPFGHSHIHPFIRKAIAPQVKHIWINRDFADWRDSVRSWEIAHPRIYPKHVKWQSDPESQTLRVRRFRRRKKKEFLRISAVFPQDCLELELEELVDYSQLCAYYEIAPPDEPFPKYNISEPS